MLRLLNGESFAAGMSHYQDHHASDNPHNSRVVVPVSLGGISTQAVIDTGGAFFVVDPKWASELSDEFSDCGEHQISIRGNRVHGRLGRCQLTLQAEEGYSQMVEVTAFIPEDHDGWTLPPILGLSNCLEVFRFAIDPATNRFYFGALTPEAY